MREATGRAAAWDGSGGAPTRARLSAALRDARQRTLEIVADLDDEQLMGPKLAIVNPLLWEIGHVAWFQERWALRRLRGRQPIIENGDGLYDSSAIPHDDRWDLPLPTRAETLGYMERVLTDVLEALGGGDRELAADELYFHLLALFHEDMHDEAFTYTRQTLAYPFPTLSISGSSPMPLEAGAEGDVDVPGGELMLGAERDLPFVFDNEQWAHRVRVEPFRIARAPVTEAQFADFTADRGYARRDLWSDEGWAWRAAAKARHPVYWRVEGDGWAVRWFDRRRPLADGLPVLHVNWHEAEAYCRWAGRRLPTEAEWEMAACSGDPPGEHKRRYPWGDAPPDGERANLDGARGALVPVVALAAGDSADGCRQMLGNVWEWTASTFEPYPGFEAGPYEDYSKPWFGTQKVLRGGCWVTRRRLIRNTWRNYYTPDRRDVWGGFRTCAARSDPEVEPSGS